MIGTAIKYFVFDFCLKICFDGINDTLKVNDNTKIPSPGDYYSKISHKLAYEVYYDCTVIEVEKIKDSTGNYNGEYLVYFNYLSKDSDVIDDEDLDNDVKAYIRELSQDTTDTDDLTEDEIEALLDDTMEYDGLYEEMDPDDLEGTDLSDIDLIATGDPYFVGVNTAFFSFTN